MDWYSIMQMLMGGGAVAGVVELGTWLRNRRADKAKAEAEAAQASANAKTSDIEAQRQEIDLMKYMRETMAEWMAHADEGNEKNFANQQMMMDKLDSLDTRLERIELRVGDIETYLNGDYHKWQSEHNRTSNNSRYGHPRD